MFQQKFSLHTQPMRRKHRRRQTVNITREMEIILLMVGREVVALQVNREVSSSSSRFEGHNDAHDDDDDDDDNVGK